MKEKKRCKCGHDIDCHSYGEAHLDNENSWCDECECDRFESEVCKCGHQKTEHIKAYKEDLKDGQLFGEPYNCLVIKCNCRKFAEPNKNEEVKI